MPELGKNQTLIINRETSAGLFLGADDGSEVLLPFKYAPSGFQVGDEIKVFVYPDSEGRPIATTRLSNLEIGEFAYVQAKSISPFGAFMDIGTDKDVLVPFKEQKQKIETGKSYVIHMYFDDQSGRFAGSCLINKYLIHAPEEITPGQEVSILIYEKTDLGWNAITDNKYRGLLYFNEVYIPLRTGQKTKAFVRKRWENGRLDLRLFPEGFEQVVSAADLIFQKLKDSDGFLPINDDSDPVVINHVLGISKKVFKKSIGTLLKSKRITMDETGIRIV
jgi:uncharacterized protein